MSLPSTLSKIPLTEFSQDEIKNAFESFDQRMNEYNRQEIRNKNIYNNSDNNNEDDDNNEDEIQEDYSNYIPKKSDKFILIEEEDSSSSSSSSSPSSHSPSPSLSSSSSDISEESSSKMKTRMVMRKSACIRMTRIGAKAARKDSTYYCRGSQKQGSRKSAPRRSSREDSSEEERINKRQFNDINQYTTVTCARKSAMGFRSLFSQDN